MAVVDKHILTLLGLNSDRPSNTLGRRAGSRIRLLHGSTNSSAAPPRTHERRQTERLTPEQTKWADAARLRPGLDVHVVDIGTHGVLLETAVRLHIGQRMEMTLTTNDGETRLDLAGAVRRCHISSLSPLVYRGALEFDDSIELLALEPFVTLSAISA
jgi:PilZ domain